MSNDESNPESQSQAESQQPAPQRKRPPYRAGQEGQPGRIRRRGNPANRPQGPDSEPPRQREPLRYVHSTNLPELLESFGITVAITTYQAGRVMLVRARHGKLNTLLRAFPRPMGMAVSANAKRIALACGREVYTFRNAPEIGSQIDPEGKHDACYLPRNVQITGDFRAHEMVYLKPLDQESSETSDQADPNARSLYVINTRFSCLSRIVPDYSFEPVWRPKWITKLAAEDRCHLNGLAVRDDQPAYYTAHGNADTHQGWRENKADGGVIIDHETSELVSTGLSMPHSPRLYQLPGESESKLYVLNSGMAQLETVDTQTGQRESIARLQGFTRGLAFHDHYALIGLSRVREKREFGGLPIEEFAPDKKCGLYVVDLKTGQTVAHLEFEAGCHEIFDVQILPYQNPAFLGLAKDNVNNIFLVPNAEKHFG